jgi:hypothetical protein
MHANRVAVQPTANCRCRICHHDFAVVRYNPNGTLDIGFGNGGKIITISLLTVAPKR